MSSSTSQPSWHPEQLSLLKQLLDCRDLAILTNQAGGNSKVFCAHADGKKWAIKSYPPYAPNQRDRLSAECQVYEFLNERRVPAVPTLKGYSTSERWLIIDWIDGTIPSHYQTTDIAQAIQFIRHIAALNHTTEAKDLPLAAEACLSLNLLLKQIEQRFLRLQTITPAEPKLANFLTNSFMPVFQQIKALAIAGYTANKIDPAAELTQEKRSLIPADFGFHNTLRDADGNLFFFDFDYFGWDDPVKLLADILWHPKMNLSPTAQQQFTEGIAQIYHTDSQFLTRLHYTLPLFGLRWTLILLNEFIPAFWQNRQHANADQQQAAAQEKQLAAATQLLAKITAPPASLFLP